MNVYSESPLIFTIDNLLSKRTCDFLVTYSESLKYGDAPITIDGGKGIFQMNQDVRNNTRVILDNDWAASLLYDQLKEELPQTFKDEWKITKLNPRFRFYRYEAGQTFKPHVDGKYKESDTCESKLTLLIYLSEGFVGGETTFFDKTEDKLRLKITPKLGQVLVFDHHQLHSGDPVIEGVKYVLRTDVMYTKL